jgi:hypothetical protein
LIIFVQVIYTHFTLPTPPLSKSKLLRFRPELMAIRQRGEPEQATIHSVLLKILPGLVQQRGKFTYYVLGICYLAVSELDSKW